MAPTLRAFDHASNTLILHNIMRDLALLLFSVEIQDSKSQTEEEPRNSRDYGQQEQNDSLQAGATHQPRFIKTKTDC